MLNQKEAEIAQLSLVGNTSLQISEALHLSEDFILATLRKSEVQQWKEEAEIAVLARGVELTRLRAARDTMGTIMDGIKKIAENIEAEKWNKNHVELFKMLITNLAKEDAKALSVINNTYIQNNNTVVKESSMLSGLEEKLSKLPGKKQVDFWQEVDTLVRKYTAYATTFEVVQD